MAKTPNVNKGNKYARDVVAGKVLACEYVRLACKRHLTDLDRDFGYKFDRDLGERVCKFVQLLPHTKGKWAQKHEPIVLEPWQCFVLMNIFGWISKETGYRKYSEVYLEIARKNGKSILSAAIGLYMLCMDNEFGAEVYSGATTEKQAWEVFRPARLMAARTQALCDAYGLEVNAKTMAIPEDGSRFEPLIGNPGDGASPSCALIDEYHEHQDPRLYDTMITGMGARDQALAVIITTAGSSIGGPCHEKRGYAQKILQGALHDERIFSMIYTLDKGDDWLDSKNLIKANPNLGVSVSEDFLKAQVHRAVQSPTQQNVVKTKHFNIWVGAKNAWLNMEQWNGCADPTLSIEDFKGEPCVIGLDLATRIDVAAAVQVFYREEADGLTHYYAFPHFWLPEDAVDTARNSQRYRGWASQGLINLMDGAEIDLKSIQDWLVGDPDDDDTGLASEYYIAEVAYDPWQASQLAQTASAQGARVVEFRNIVSNMSPAMKELEGAITSGRFHFDGNPILTWMASNVVAKLDAKDNIYPVKEQPENKIDGIVALIMAIGRAFYAQEARSAYESETLMVI